MRPNKMRGARKSAKGLFQMKQQIEFSRKRALAVSPSKVRSEKRLKAMLNWNLNNLRHGYAWWGRLYFDPAPPGNSSRREPEPYDKMTTNLHCPTCW